ncbi:MAG: helix-turn-helix domain-containing protein [Clostridia bacterium]|nr:helix-turn-helix domain-containing protein [Clostridia bacterium]
MTTTVFSENLKRFRMHKNLTQEQAAQALGVNSQTVSRWECGNTLPDVMLLPVIAELYGVTVDDLYRKNSPMYKNYADRLSSVYEKTRDPEDFMRCRAEYMKLMKEGELSISDKWNFAIIHHFMLSYCRDVALEWYDKAKADDPVQDEHSYYRAKACRGDLLRAIGRFDEYVAEQEKMAADHPDNPREMCLLLGAYYEEKKYEKAYDCFLKAKERFPDDWMVYIYGGDTCEAMGRDEEALAYWDKAGELGTYFHDELYSKACYYNDRGEYRKACDIYTEIASLLRSEGYDVDAEMAERCALEAKAKIKP